MDSSQAWAEFAGILLGDGSLGIYRSQAANRIKIIYRVKVTLDDREVQYAQYVQNLMESLFYRRPVIRTIPSEHTCNIFLSGKKHTDCLLAMGFKTAPKMHRAIIPEQFLTPESELRVVRGYFDTDGSVVIANNNGTPYPRLEMKISPSPMQQQFIDILRRHQFHFGVYPVENGHIRIQLNGRNQLQRWWELIGFSNERHITKARPFLFVESPLVTV